MGLVLEARPDPLQTPWGANSKEMLELLTLIAVSLYIVAFRASPLSSARGKLKDPEMVAAFSCADWLKAQPL
jgi:hypothetical protein